MSWQRMLAGKARVRRSFHSAPSRVPKAPAFIVTVAIAVLHIWLGLADSVYAQAGRTSTGDTETTEPREADPDQAVGDDAAEKVSQDAANKLTQIVGALQVYHEEHGHLPPAVLLGPDGKTPHSWRVALLPYLDRGDLYRKYRFDEPWDSANNKGLIVEGGDLYNALPDAAPGHSTYFVMSGPGAAFDPKQPPCKRADLRDGERYSIAVVEAQRAIPWTKPQDLDFRGDGALPKLGGVFLGGYHIAMWDGSPWFVPEDTDEAVLRALITRAGGELVEWSYKQNKFVLRDPREARLETIRTSSSNRLKNIGVALVTYRQVHKQYPPAVLIGPDGKTPHSWRVALLPYMDCEDLYKRYRLDEPWDSPHNKEVIAEGVDLYTMPSAKKHDCCYFMLTGPGSAFNPDRPASVFRVNDGPHFTLGVVEARRAIPWTKPEDISFTADAPLPKVGGYFKEGFGAMFLDSSVRFLPADTGESVLRALISANGKEPIEWDTDEPGRARLGEANR